jgi:hypothetical protein
MRRPIWLRYGNVQPANESLSADENFLMTKLSLILELEELRKACSSGPDTLRSMYCR